MRIILTLTGLMYCILSVYGQNFPGLRSDNYTGVTGVFFNPANIADSRYKWDVSLIGIHTYLGNNNATFSLSNISDVLDNAEDMIFDGSGNKVTNAQAFADVTLPSFMITINPKTTIAFTSRMRLMANIRNIDGNIVEAIEASEDILLPYSFNSDQLQKIAATGWSEFGFSVGRVLLSSGSNFLKAGATLKYMGGIANTFLSIGNIRGTINEDMQGNTFLTNASGTVGLGYAGISINGAEEVAPFQFNVGGLGADLGLVYEYRPKADKFYRLKASLSLVDIGSLKFNPEANQFGNYTFNIGNFPDQFNLDQLAGKSVEEIKDILDKDPRFVKNLAGSGIYRAGMPTTLHAAVDVALGKYIFTELQFMAGVNNKDNPYSVFMPTAFTIIPRFETRHFGASFPININQFTGFNAVGFNAGIVLRAGPLFIGSGSLLTAAFGNSKQADLLVGVRFGGLKKKETKISKTDEVKFPPDSG